MNIGFCFLSDKTICGSISFQVYSWLFEMLDVFNLNLDTLLFEKL